MNQPVLFRIYRRALALTSYALPAFAGAISAKRFMTPTRHQRPAWEEKVIELGEKKTLATQLQSWHWGEGPQVLLVHGWDGRGSQLGFFVAPLVEAGFRVIAIDGPAHGDSPGKRTNLRDFAQKMLRLQQELGALHGVIAHSFGCAATVFAVDNGFFAKKLVLIASPCDLQDIFDRFTSFMQLSPKSKKYFQHFIEKEAQLNVEDVRMNHIISRIQRPVLVIHDKRDQEIPYSDALKLTEGLEQATLVSTEGLGHRRILRSEQVVNKVIDFLGVQ